MKKYRGCTLFLAILIILFVSACASENQKLSDFDSEPNHSQQEQTAPEDASGNFLNPYTMSVRISDQQELTVILDTEQPEDDYFPVSSILVYDGEQLLQTLGVPSVSPDDTYAWDGLFVNKGYAVGEPDIRDVNFDGAEDFGLLAVNGYPHNVPYSYFVWNEENALFEYGFTLFGATALEIDENEQCLVETSHDTMGTYKTVYKYLSDGTLSKESSTELGEPVSDTGK